MKKLLITGLVVAFCAMNATVLFVAPVRAASAGDLIKMDGNPAVYYLGSDEKRYVFPNQHAYMTWYEDFSGVVTVSQSELESYSIGGNVTYRPGSYMVKITTDPKTYAVEPGGVLRWVTSETIAEELYGAEWWLKIQDVPDPFFVNYTTGSDITDSTYPDGTLVQETGGTTTYYIEDGTKRPIADEAAFDANNFNWDYVLTAASLTSYSDGSSITGYEEAIGTVAGPGTPAPPSTSVGTLTVSLAADTPAATTVVKSATRVKFTKINFTASGGDVVIDSVTIKRTGLAQDSNFSNVYLLDSADNVHGNEKTLGSTHTAVVNDDITVSNGTTKSYWISGTMHSTLQAGEIAGLALSAVEVTGDATVSGTLPIEGNSMTMNNTITIGTVTQDTTLSTTATKPVGTDDYTFASARLTVNSTEDVQIEKIRFYQAGTAADSDVANLDLLVDGVVLATVAEPTDKAVIFDLSASPFSITKGNNKTFELKGDIVDGSARTIDFEFTKKTDVVVKGKTYGFYITPSYNTSNSSSPYWNNAAVVTVSTGTLTVSKATVDSTSIAEGATQQEVGAFYFHAQGEPIIVTQMVMTVTTSSNVGTISNVTMYDEDGEVIAGPQDPSSGSDPDSATLGDTFTVPVGINKYIVKADLDTNFSANDTIRIDFTNGPDADVTAKGEVTDNSVTPSPTSAIQGSTVTVKTSDLNVSTSSSPAAQTVAAGTSGFIFANFVLDATQSGEDIKVTQLLIKHTSSAINLHSYITGITLFDGDTALNTPQAGESSTTSSTATSTITLTDPLIVTKNTAKTLVLKADISGSAANNSTHQFGMVETTGVTAYGNSTGNSVGPDITNSDGQTMTITTAGTLQMANSGSNPVAGLVVADTTSEIGVFNFKPLYEDIQVEKLGFDFGGTANSHLNVDWLQFYDGTTKLGEIQVTGDKATITPSSLILTQNITKPLTLKAVTHKVGSLESGTSGQNFTVTLTGMDAKGVSTGSTSVTKSGLDTVASNAQYIYKTKPTITKVNLSGMANGTQDLYKFTLTADSKGDVGFYKATFALTTSSATITNLKFYEIVGSSETDLSLTAINSNELLTAHTANAGGKFAVNVLFDTDSDGVSDGGELRTIGAGTSKTYVLRGDVTGWDSNASMQVQMMSDNTAPTVQKATTVDGVSKTDNFIWSDLFLGYTSTTATGANEWTGAYKLFATTTQSF